MIAATDGPTGSTGLRRRRLILAALAVSLVLNLCFVAGAAWTRLNEPPAPGERFKAIAGELNLTATQSAAFDLYLKAIRERSREARADIDPIVAAAWTEIAKPHPDEAQIGRLFDQAAEKRRSFQRDGTTATLQFLTTLTPEQRTKFVTLVRERRAHWHHH